MSYFSLSLCHSWMDTPCPWRGLGDTYAAAMLNKRQLGREWGVHTEPDVLWTGCVRVSMVDIYVCISVFMYREQEQGRAQLPKPKYIERRRKQEEGKIQNSREQLADEVTWCESGGPAFFNLGVPSHTVCYTPFSAIRPLCQWSYIYVYTQSSCCLFLMRPTWL